MAWVYLVGLTLVLWGACGAVMTIWIPFVLIFIASLAAGMALPA